MLINTEERETRDEINSNNKPCHGITMEGGDEVQHTSCRGDADAATTTPMAEAPELHTGLYINKVCRLRAHNITDGQRTR